MTFEEIVWLSLEANAIPDALALSDPQAYVAKRMKQRREAPPTYVQEHAGGERWSFVRDHRMEDGKVIQLRIDITERRQAEEALKAAKREAELNADLLNATFESIDQGIAVVDSDMQILRCNTNGAKF